jgi:predicted GNAT family N-acyltransferase
MVRIALLNWEQAEPVAAPLRFGIFMQEKQAEGIELDERDKDCLHAVAYDETGKAIGTARLLPDGEIGRMAVLKDWRRRGVGVALLEALLEEARKRGHHEVTMNVPLQAAEFYRSQGFNGEGKIQKIGDMLQQRMRRAL